MKILVVDDDKNICMALIRLLKDDYEVLAVSSGEEALKKIKEAIPDGVLLDIRMPGGMDGIETLIRLKEIDENIVAIIMTAYGTIENAVEAMGLGAFDYITKPFNNKELKLRLKKAFETRDWREYASYFKTQSQQEQDKYSFENIIRESRAMEEVLSLVEKAAKGDITVLVQGETGTGKELIARAIHYHSRRKDKPFIPVNCAGIARDITESELFGIEKGVATDVNMRAGMFEQANKGTIFLDEIGDMPLEAQAEILRVLQDKQVRRLGGDYSQVATVDIRVIAATNQDLSQMVGKGDFRSDLFFRLNVFPILVPPLRDRAEDIPVLVDHFVAKHGHASCSGKISQGFVDALQAYNWPGNVRELENVIERVLITSDADVLTSASLPIDIIASTTDLDTAEMTLVHDLATKITDNEAESCKEKLDEIKRQLERMLIVKLLEATKGVVKRAAEKFGVTREGFHEMMRRNGIGADQFRQREGSDR